jgi:S-DNA-T family DNA segregation ATPase FtsK/SpoIIIE
MALRTDLRARTARAGRLFALAAVLVTAGAVEAATTTTTSTTSTATSTPKGATTSATTKPVYPWAAKTNSSAGANVKSGASTSAKSPATAKATTTRTTTTPATTMKPVVTTAAAMHPATTPARTNAHPPVMLLSNAANVHPVVPAPQKTLVATSKPTVAATTRSTTTGNTPTVVAGTTGMTMPLTVVRANYRPMPNVASGRSTTAQGATARVAAKPTAAPMHPMTTALPSPSAPVVATVHGATTTTATATKTATVPSFQDRMARTTVTPPVAATGAKATLVTPTHATTTTMTPAATKPTATQLAATKATVAPVKTAATMPTPAKLAVTPHVTTQARPAELALFLHAKPDWTFRQVKSGASTTAGMHATQLAARTATATTATKLAATTPSKAGPATKPGAKPATSASARPVTGALAATTHPAKVVGAKGESMSTSVQTLGARFMEQREQYVYDSLNRRDPFASLVSGSFETEVGTPLLDVSSMKLVGIVWGATDKFALVEDGHGHGFVLRVGDPVLNGYIAGLTKEELIVKQSSYGDTQTVTIQLQRKDGASNGN